jgi:uncharacterized membrane protein YqjE
MQVPVIDRNMAVAIACAILLMIAIVAGIWAVY